MSNELETTNQKAMTKERRDELVDALLIELNDEVDSLGRPINVVRFTFSEEESVDQLNSLSICFEELARLLDLCLSRKYLKHTLLGGGKYYGLSLTEEGQGRAISADVAKRMPKPSGQSDASIHIGTINASAAQVGNNNTLNIQDFSASLIEKIDQADASDEDKKEAKGRLKSFLKHPLVIAVLGSAAAAAATALLKGE